MAASDRKLNGMGTTLVALLEDGDMVHVANVGDSRGYLLRQGELSQVTVDHSLVQELVDDGRLSPEDAERHPQRSVITRALGIDPEVEFDLFTYKLQVGDRLLLCSDGLSDVVEPAQIRKVLLRVRSAQRAARELVTVANEQGGPDNITVIVVDAVDEATAEAEEDGGDTTGDLAAGSATGALPLVGDAELDGDRRAGSGRAARAAKDRSLAMHRRLQRFLIAGIVVVAVAVPAGRRAQLPVQPLLGRASTATRWPCSRGSPATWPGSGSRAWSSAARSPGPRCRPGTPPAWRTGSRPTTWPTPAASPSAPRWCSAPTAAPGRRRPRPRPRPRRPRPPPAPGPREADRWSPAATSSCRCCSWP